MVYFSQMKKGSHSEKRVSNSLPFLTFKRVEKEQLDIFLGLQDRGDTFLEPEYACRELLEVEKVGSGYPVNFDRSLNSFLDRTKNLR